MRALYVRRFRLRPRPETELQSFFNGSGLGIETAFYTGSPWGWASLVKGVAAGTSPAAVIDPSTGYPMVFFNGSGGGIELSYYTGLSWAWTSLGHGMAPGTGPAAIIDPSTTVGVQQRFGLEGVYDRPEQGLVLRL